MALAVAQLAPLASLAVFFPFLQSQTDKIILHRCCSECMFISKDSIQKEDEKRQCHSSPSQARMTKSEAVSIGL